MKTQHWTSLTTVFLTSALMISACGGGDGSTSNPITITQVTLGKKLFFDQNLSSNSNQSCADCHAPSSGFADPDVTQAAPVSEGSVDDRFGNRNAPTAVYASFIPSFTQTTTATPAPDITVSHYQGGQFLDGRRSTLVEQAKDPFLNPVEMNNIDEADVVSKVQNAAYANEFIQVFGQNALNDVDTAYDNIATAIAAFEASNEMNPFTSKFDAVMADQAEFTESERRGFDLFKGTKAKCANCHTVNNPPERSLFTDFNYFNIGTPLNPNNPAYIADNAFRDGGLGDSPVLTEPAQQAAERGKFRTPTLRNIQLTAPYMHNGVYASLEEVIRHYDISVANYDGLGSFEPEILDNIANELGVVGSYQGLGLDSDSSDGQDDYTDLINFMNTLTDGYF